MGTCRLVFQMLLVAFEMPSLASRNTSEEHGDPSLLPRDISSLVFNHSHLTQYESLSCRVGVVVVVVVVGVVVVVVV